MPWLSPSRSAAASRIRRRERYVRTDTTHCGALQRKVHQSRDRKPQASGGAISQHQHLTHSAGTTQATQAGKAAQEGRDWYVPLYLTTPLVQARYLTCPRLRPWSPSSSSLVLAHSLAPSSPFFVPIHCTPGPCPPGSSLVRACPCPCSPSTCTCTCTCLALALHLHPHLLCHTPPPLPSPLSLSHTRSLSLWSGPAAPPPPLLKPRKAKAAPRRRYMQGVLRPVLYKVPFLPSLPTLPGWVSSSPPPQPTLLGRPG